MPALLRFHLDESVHHAVAVGLRRRGIDVTTTTDAGLIGEGDQAQLGFAHHSHRVLVTHDDDFLRLHAAGLAHSGIAYCHPGRRTIGQVITG